ncbi:hypothetical protein EDC01DRAFT_624726 [Geopyxis carbonaria]|nr:hypothetical protein EDC01DRAFT_624726 [Geopyxis carbonaria]
MAVESAAIDPTTRSRESTDLPESQRIISEHLAAHMSKIAPPPAQPQQPSNANNELLLEQRLAAQLQQNGFQAPVVATGDTNQGFVSINPNNDPPPMPRASKRKRVAVDNNAAVANQALMVDPQLMQLDQDAALALGASGEGNTGKVRKRRKPAIGQDVNYVPTLQEDIAKTPRRLESTKSNWGTATPNPGESVNGGTFDLTERHAIDKALADYGTAHGMTIMELRDRVWGNNRKKDEFWNEICRAVPNRSRASVYKHVRRSCHIFEQRAKWTEPEDNQLAALVAEKGNKWKEIGLAMDRMGEDCRDRYRNYVKCGKDRGTDRWSAEEEELLKQTVANQMEQSRDQLRREGKPIPQDKEGELTLINWTVISDLMDNRRSRIQCRYKWKKMIAQKERVQRAPIGVTYEGGKRKRIAFDIQQMLPGDKYWLTLQVRDSGVSQESEIPWDMIAKNDTDIGIWTHKDLKTAFKQFRSHLPYRRRPLSEIIRELLIESESLPDDLRNTRFVPNANEDDGVQDMRTVSSYSPSAAGAHRSPAQGNFEIPMFTMAPEQPGNVAPVASMAGIPTMHQDPNLALDPSLAGMEDLEKTAGEAIAYSAGLEAAARVARSVVGTSGSNNHEDDNELRERLGSFLKATTPGP